MLITASPPPPPPPGDFSREPSKNGTLKQCWIKVGPPSATLAQPETSICWGTVYIIKEYSKSVHIPL